MTAIRLDSFQGIMPRLSPTLLGTQQAQIAENCDLHTRVLEPYREPLSVTTVPAGTISAFPYNGSWLAWPTDVDVARGPIAEDQYQRIYYTGDGTPKVRGIEAAVEYEYDLGIPAPANTPAVATVAKSTTDWTRTWFYFYEEPDGSQVDNGTLTEGVDVILSDGGRVYTLATIPAKVAASAEAIFVMGFDAYESSGLLLGRLYPTPSRYASSTDVVVAGAITTGSLVVTTNAVLTLTFDTSTTGEYTVSRTYVQTFVSGWGEEGPPSAASAVIDVDPTQDVLISGLDTSVVGNYNVTKKRIYRTVTVGNDTELQFVLEVDLADATALDTLADADTGEQLRSETWIAPPADLAGLVAMPNAFLAGFSGKTVHFTPANTPHAWPDAYALTIDYDIVALGVSGNSLVVATTGYPYIMTGVDPTSMTVTRLAENQACASKRGLTDFGLAVAYPSPDGLVMVQGADARVVSEGYYTREEWQALDPTTMVGAVHDKRYHGFTSTSAFVWDFDEKQSAWVTTTEAADGLHADIETDTLYLIQDPLLVAWAAGVDPLDVVWRSKRFLFPRPVSFSVGKVVADAYPVTLKLLADQALVATLTVLDEGSFMLPVLRQERIWEIQLETANTVRQAAIAQTVREL